jgi:serine/threonine protein kinase
MWTPGNDKLVDNRFYLEKVLGQGGFGITFLAQDRSKGSNDAKCVIKTLKKDIPDFDSQQSKFRQEALNLAKCSHPHVVAVQDVIFHDGIWGLVMDYVDGDTLYTVMRDRPQERLSEQVALEYIDHIGQALEFVHDRGLLHRDIKPLNIMVCRKTNKAILIDFGLARDFVFDDSRSMTAMMTEGFAPIEQYDRRGKFGPYTDVYALAATLYCVLVGEAPLFNAKGRKQAADGGKSIDNFMWEKLQEVGVSDRVQQAIIWGMQVMAGDRPPSMGEWREALGLVSRSIPQGVQFESTGRSPVVTEKEVPYRGQNRESLKFVEQYNEPILSVIPQKIGRPNWLFVAKWSFASLFGYGSVFLLAPLFYQNSLNPLRELSHYLFPARGDIYERYLSLTSMIFSGVFLAFLQWLILKKELSSRIWFAINSISLLSAGIVFITFFQGFFHSKYHVYWVSGLTVGIFLTGICIFLNRKFINVWWYVIVPVATMLVGNVIAITLPYLIPNQQLLFIAIIAFILSVLMMWIFIPNFLKKSKVRKYLIITIATLLFILAEIEFNAYMRSQGLLTSFSSFMFISTSITSCLSSGLVMDWLVRNNKKAPALG